MILAMTTTTENNSITELTICPCNNFSNTFNLRFNENIRQWKSYYTKKTLKQIKFRGSKEF